MAQKTISQLTAQTTVTATDLFVVQRGSASLAKIQASVLAQFVATLVNVVTSLGYTPVNKAGDTMTGALTAPAITGPLTGNVTGNVSGSSGSCTGNAATATTAAACSGNSATATTAAACSGNAVTATLAATATAGAATFEVAGLTAARVAAGVAANSGRISWGTAAPGTLAVGEIYLQVPAT